MDSIHKCYRKQKTNSDGEMIEWLGPKTLKSLHKWGPWSGAGKCENVLCEIDSFLSSSWVPADLTRG